MWFSMHNISIFLRIGDIYSIFWNYDRIDWNYFMSELISNEIKLTMKKKMEIYIICIGYYTLQIFRDVNPINNYFLNFKIFYEIFIRYLHIYSCMYLKKHAAYKKCEIIKLWESSGEVHNLISFKMEGDFMI
jgi:hypothetical protein